MYAYADSQYLNARARPPQLRASQLSQTTAHMSEEAGTGLRYQVCGAVPREPTAQKPTSTVVEHVFSLADNEVKQCVWGAKVCQNVRQKPV